MVGLNASRHNLVQLIVNRCPIRVVAKAFGSFATGGLFFSWVSDGLLLFLSPLLFLIFFLLHREDEDGWWFD